MHVTMHKVAKLPPGVNCPKVNHFNTIRFSALKNLTAYIGGGTQKHTLIYCDFFLYMYIYTKESSPNQGKNQAETFPFLTKQALENRLR